MRENKKAEILSYRGKLTIHKTASKLGVTPYYVTCVWREQIAKEGIFNVDQLACWMLGSRTPDTTIPGSYSVDRFHIKKK